VSFTFVPGPTGQRFLDDRSYVKVIMGPVGGGKSTLALMDLLRRSVEQQPFDGVRRTKHGILRNTVGQLKSTVKPLIDHWLGLMTGNTMGQWKLTDGTFEARFRLPDGTRVHADFTMLAADTPDDVRRLLSLELSSGWVEECREVDQSVFEGFLGRVARYPNRASGGVTYPGVVCSTNPPPFGSWWQRMISNPPKNWGVFLQPPAMLEDGSLNPKAENLENLDPNYYANLLEGKSEDWINVYMKNKFGSGGFGEPVFAKTFRMDFHVAKEELKPIFSSVNPILVGMDNGLTAAAVIGQMDLRGRVNILDECYVPEGETMGVETFMSRMLVPLLVQRYPVKPEHIRFVLDPACWQRSQANEMTIAQVVAAQGYGVVKASTNDPEKRIMAVEGLLNRAIDGGPGLLISPRCPWLIQAMSWGYRNKKAAAGYTTATPEKTHHSHIADALQYLCLHYNLQVHPAAAVFRPKAPEIKRVAYRYA
jgi:hypothetical protein